MRDHQATTIVSTQTMEPRVRYVRTEDDVSIAYYSIGEGEPLVHLPALPISHVRVEWQQPEWRSWYRRLAEHRRLIRFDTRGSGLSDREISSYSLDGLLRDLTAVVDRLGDERIALFAPGNGALAAVAFAHRYPERVSRLILWCAVSGGKDYLKSSAAMALVALTGQDWETFTQAMAHIVFGWEAGEDARLAAAAIRDCITPEVYYQATVELRDMDVGDALPHITCPTLIIHRREYKLIDLATAKEIAARIPNAQLAVLEGNAGVPWVGDMERALATIEQFLDGTGDTGELAPVVDRSSTAAERLTGRELEVLRLIAAGRSSREIAAELVLSVRTVERHISNLYTKIDAHNRAQATAFALANDLA